MTDDPDLKTELEAWCASYVTAFETFDAEMIGAHWAFPAMVVSNHRQLVMADADTFNRNTGHLIAFYERQNARKVVREVLFASPMLAESAMMRVKDTISTPAGEPITEWVSAYVLRKTDAGWKAIFADATGEADAWAARGTPLGS